MYHLVLPREHILWTEREWEENREWLMNGAFKIQDRNNSSDMWSLNKDQMDCCLSLGWKRRNLKHFGQTVHKWKIINVWTRLEKGGKAKTVGFKNKKNRTGQASALHKVMWHIYCLEVSNIAFVTDKVKVQLKWDGNCFMFLWAWLWHRKFCNLFLIWCFFLHSVASYNGFTC